MTAEKKDNTDRSGTEEQLDQAQLIEETGSVRSQNAKHLIHCLTIIGQVEGHNILPEDTKTTKYEHILPALVAIEQDRSIQGLLILLNTMGGDVEAGLAIAEMIAGMKTPTVSLVIGGGHSIGIHDGAPGSHQLIGAGCPPDCCLFRKNTGAHQPFYFAAQPDFRRGSQPHDAEHPGAGHRYRYGDLRCRGRRMRPDRSDRHAA